MKPAEKIEIILHHHLDRDLMFAASICQLVEAVYPDGANADEISRVLRWATERFGRSPYAPASMFPPGMNLTVTHKDEPEFPKD